MRSISNVIEKIERYQFQFSFSGGALSYRAAWVMERLKSLEARIQGELNQHLEEIQKLSPEALQEMARKDRTFVVGRTSERGALDVVLEGILLETMTLLNSLGQLREAIFYISQTPPSNMVALSLHEYRMLGGMEEPKRQYRNHNRAVMQKTIVNGVSLAEIAKMFKNPALEGLLTSPEELAEEETNPN